MSVSSHEPAVKAGKAVAEQGYVVLDGPHGVAVAMTPDAADGTADSLHLAAAEARQQRASH